MNFIATLQDGTEVYMGEDLIVLKAKNGMMQRITPEETYITDQYGNEMSLTEIRACFTQNSPTYDELYEHWLKTKKE